MFRLFIRYKYKTALIIISATAAIASIFLITALGNGIIRMYADMLRTDGDLIVMQKGVADTFFSDVNRSLVDPISKIKGVQSAQAVMVAAGAIDTVPIAGIYGVSENRYPNYHLLSGNYPRKKGDVIIGDTIRMLLNDPETITLMGKKFHVTGIYKSSIGFENGGVVINIEDAASLFKKDASFLLITLKDIDMEITPIIQKINSLDENIETKSTTEFIDNYNQFKIIRISSAAIASISFFMGFLAIVSLMSIMIHDRTYEFGIKRALGIKKKKILQEIILEVTVLISISFILAFLVSLLGLYILEHIPKFQGYLSGKIDMVLFIKLLVGSLIMAIAGALIPALIAIKTDPVILILRGR
jgi:ABC-type antimicrobial peptide transport system permease subunit